MLKTPRYLLNCSFSWIPLASSRNIYKAHIECLKKFHSLRFKSNRNSFSIWPRHSYIKERLQPFLSDVDLTLFFHHTVSPETIYAHASFIKKTKYLLPLIGELNIYPYSWIHSALAHINPHELERDPLLMKTAHANPREKTKWTQFVFLVRNLEADQVNLESIPRLRSLKWNGHLEDLNLEPMPDPLTFSNLLSLTCKILDSSEIERDLKFYFEARKKQMSILEISKHLNQYPWIWACFPNRFCHLRDSEPPMPELNESQKVVFVEQIRWEIWAALTQHFNFFKNREMFFYHLKNINYHVKDMNLSPNISEELLKAIDLLKSVTDVSNLI